MNDMLSDALREYHGLRREIDEHLLGRDSQLWKKRFSTCLREEPTCAEGMIYPPLEWMRVSGQLTLDLVETRLSFLAPDVRWRLPTLGEIRRAVKIMKPEGFEIGKFYWTSTPHSDGKSLSIYKTYDGLGGGCVSSNRMEREVPWLRLCREMDLPESREVVTGLNR